MGQHTEEFRALLDSLPRTPKGLTPELAVHCIVQIANGALQVIAKLEEAQEDLEKENARLAEMLLEAGIVPQWTPTEL